MFIAYDIRNGVEYAKLCTSKRNGKQVTKDYVYLGKVINKEKFIYQNKERGTFKYNPVDNSYTVIGPNTDVSNATLQQNQQTLFNVAENDMNVFDSSNKNIQTNKDSEGFCDCLMNEEMLNNVLTCGDVDFVNTVLKQNNFSQIVNQLNQVNTNLLYVYLLCYVINGHCAGIEHWYNHSVAKVMFKLSDNKVPDGPFDGIDDDLFLSVYLNFIRRFYSLDVNVVRVSLGGNQQNCQIYISDRNKVPLFLNSGYVYDVFELFISRISSLNVIVCDNISVLSSETIELFEQNSINFIANVTNNSEIYNEILENYRVNNLQLITHNGKFFHVCHSTITYKDHVLHTYSYSDVLKNGLKTVNLLQNNINEMDINDIKQQLNISFDYMFVCLHELDANIILDNYVEQRIGHLDSGLNVNFLLLCKLVEHMLISVLDKKNISLDEAMTVLGNRKCFYLNDKIIVQTCDKDMEKIYSCLRLDY